MMDLTRVYGRRHEPYSLFSYHRMLGFGLIVGERKWDAKASGTPQVFFFFPREAYVVVVFTHKTEC